MTTNRPLKVFLCHSSADKPAVRELYQKLRAEPWIQPWLDEEELFPGMDWNMEIEKAIEATDVILVCLSKDSITKEGYVQRELRIVLDFADYKPEGTLYLIPVRLEECEPPRRLRAWQYADYFEGNRERGLQRLLVSLKKRAESLKLDFSASDVENKDGGLVEQAIYVIRGYQYVTPSLIQRHLKLGYIQALRLLEKLEVMGLVGPSEASLQKREVLVGEKVSSYEEDHDLTDLLISSENATLESFENKPAVEVSKTILFEHPTSEWIAANNITLSNGMEFMRVPAGKFLMGSDNHSEHEKPQHTVDIPYDYWMACFSVTNELYNAYAKAKGIKHPVNGWEKKKDHPVTYVKWTDAMAYCEWLNKTVQNEEFIMQNLQIRLPTEAEWEKAARGTDGYEYPWGNQFDKNKCNTRESGNGSTTPVRLYSPQGDSPFGCADMTGNVREWTHSLMKPYPYNVRDGREDEKASGARVLRGGSFIRDEWDARCAYRYVSDINALYYVIGFRVVVASLILS